ncbi:MULTISPECIES: hypothetical protein [unclassified Aeromonas]|uniref:hypothetical protein n=1 Tax=unclassified Aeromonas TaxID=257493 RepID=UPI0035299FFF
MPFIKKHLPFIPAVFDSHLSDSGYFKMHLHPCNSINMEPQTHTLTEDELAAAIVDTEEAVEAAGYWLAPSPFIYSGKGNIGYKRHLADLLAAWLVQRDTVTALLPHFWIYAAVKMREQSDFLRYLQHTLDHEYRTTQVWASLVKMAQSSVKYHVTIQHCPTL